MTDTTAPPNGEEPDGYDKAHGDNGARRRNAMMDLDECLRLASGALRNAARLIGSLKNDTFEHGDWAPRPDGDVMESHVNDALRQIATAQAIHRPYQGKAS